MSGLTAHLIIKEEFIMAVIHIQEVNSDQVTEIIAETVEKALWAYAHNACFRWSE